MSCVFKFQNEHALKNFEELINSTDLSFKLQ